MPTHPHVIRGVNLTSSEWRSEWIPVPPGSSRISADLLHDDDAFTMGAAVLELEFTLANTMDPVHPAEDLSNAVSFDPTVELATAARTRRNVNTSGTGYVRFRTTTPDVGADPDAKLLVIVM